MATYAVGDLQGCLKPLKCLLKEVSFDWRRDTLWLVGDIVNRGPQSLKTLRYLYKHRDSLVMVLGNHDLNLLAVANGLRKASRSDTIDKILVAHDRDELLDWLRHQPMLHREHGFTLVHAGVPPMWSLKAAERYAREVEDALRGRDWRRFLDNMYGNTPRRWRNDLSGYPRLRAITNYLTRMRYLYPNGALDLVSKGPRPEPGRNVAPWFSYPRKNNAREQIIFGHWASLDGDVNDERLHALDTGCVWGRSLTLLCLDTGELHRCQCA
jgi:bis(5'-nucleosyl)-tetraphosphatase (symmetrical)